MRRLLIALLGLLAWGSAMAQPPVDPIQAIDAARDVFEKYAQALSAGDMGILHLYTKNTKIKTLQIQVKGDPEYHTLSLADYAEQLRKEFKNPKRPSVSFDHTSYRIKGDAVLVQSKRHTSDSDFVGDFNLQVVAEGNHHWAIAEQVTELPSLYVPAPQDGQNGQAPSGETGRQD